MAHLLIVDDDPSTLASLARAFRLAGHEATVCDNASRALDLAKSQAFDMMLSDVVMPGKDGLALLEDLRSLGIALPVVMISGQANIEMAVRATRLGALDFLEKPLSTDKLLLTVDNVLKLKRLEDENRDLRQRVGKHEIVHSGERMKLVMAQVDRVATRSARIARATSADRFCGTLTPYLVGARLPHPADQHRYVHPPVELHMRRRLVVAGALGALMLIAPRAPAQGILGKIKDRARTEVDRKENDAINAVVNSVSCAITDKACIKKAHDAGAPVKVTDKNGKPVSSADSAAAISAAVRSPLPISSASARSTCCGRSLGTGTGEFIHIP